MLQIDPIESATLITDSLYMDDFDAIEDGIERGGPLAPIAICTAHTKSNGRRFSEDLAYALVRGSNQAVAFNLRARQGCADTGEIAPTLRSLGHDAVAISGNPSRPAASAKPAPKSDSITPTHA